MTVEVEEAIKRIKMILEEATENEDAVSYVTSDDADALGMAIKALEQEPFMNKPCVAHQVCHDDKVKMLDKIRDEIEFEVDHRTYMLCAEDVFEIIDKYRAGKE